jgi:hypothetical protein
MDLNGTTLQTKHIARMFKCSSDHMAEYLSAAGIEPTASFKFGRGMSRLYDRQAVMNNSVRIGQIIEERRAKRKEAMRIQQERMRTGQMKRAVKPAVRLARIEDKVDRILAIFETISSKQQP